VINETMTSSQAAINDPAEEYHVKNVLLYAVLRIAQATLST